MNSPLGALLLTIMSFACGLLAGHFLWTPDEAAPLAAQAASLPASAPTAKKIPAPPPAHRIALAAPAREAAPVMPEDYQRLKICFPADAYRGSEFVLRVTTSNSGGVTRVATSGDEFLADSERRCVQQTVKTWRLGSNLPEELVLTVVL
jgi:hypothetical protein